MIVPQWIFSLADELAASRSKISAGIYHSGTDKFRGEREHTISSLGIRAELTVRYKVWNNPNSCDVNFAPIIDTGPVVGADMVHNGETYDIKGAERSKGYLMVNYDAHNNPEKSCDWYLFVIFNDNQAEIKKVHYTQISQWPVINSTYTKVYKWQI